MGHHGFIKSIFLLVILLFALSFFLKKQPEEDQVALTHVSINGKTWEIMGLADTEATRRQGLSHREKLDTQTGMLFSFPEAGKYSFWMKDMRFPLDVIFIRPEGKVDSVALNRQPGDLSPILPQEAIIYVFEVNAGEAKDIQPGDQVEWK